jgi:hypothetical protein
LKFKLDPPLTDIPLGCRVKTHGALSLYIYGKQVAPFGQPHSNPLNIKISTRISGCNQILNTCWLSITQILNPVSLLLQTDNLTCIPNKGVLTKK